MPRLGDQKKQQSQIRLRLAMLTTVLLILIGLAIAWTWTPLRNWLDVSKIVTVLELYGQSFGPFVATAGFAFALTLAIPLTFLTLVTLVAFGPAQGFAITIVGATIGALLTFSAGKVLGHKAVRSLGGAKVNLVSERLAKSGILAVIALRMVPIAPFAIVNMVAGASHLRLRDMLLGTVIGMTPGTLVMMFFIDQLIDAIKRPSAMTALLGIAMLLLIVIGVWLFQKWFKRLNQTSQK